MPVFSASIEAQHSQVRQIQSQQYRLCNTYASCPVPKATYFQKANGSTVASFIPAQLLRNFTHSTDSYMHDTNMPPPSYKGRPITGRNIYSSVTVNSIKYISYLQEAKTKWAEKLAAQVAVAELLSKNDMPRIVTKSPYAIITRVLDIVNSHPNGLFAPGLVERYIEKYNEGLPETWLKMVERDIIVDIGINDLMILRPKQARKSQRSLLPDLAVAAPPILNLSNLDKFWFKVNRICNPMDIWGVMDSETDSAKLNDMADKMKHFYEMNTAIPSFIVIGEHYAVHDSHNWHRVRCITLDSNEKTATVFFIDRGDEQILMSSRLYLLKEEFCCIPSQALNISLAGFEEYEESTKMTKLTREIILNKTVWVKVIDAEKYENSPVPSQLQLKSHDGRIIFINRTLLEEIKGAEIRKETSTVKSRRNDQLFYLVPAKRTLCLDAVIRAPTLPTGKFRAQVTLVSDPSNFVIRRLNFEEISDYDRMIQKLSLICQQYVRNGALFDRIKVGKLVACKCTETSDSEWCRGYVLKVKYTGTASVYCVDLGCNKTVNCISLIPLDKEYCILPYQAIWARLDGVQPVLNATSKGWSLEACIYFQELTQSKHFICQLGFDNDKTANNMDDNIKSVPVAKIHNLKLYDENSYKCITEALVEGAVAIRI